MYKIKQNAMFIFKLVFTFIFLCMCSIAIINPSTLFNEMMPFILFLLFALILLFGFKACDYVSKLNDKHKKMIIAISFLVVIILQVIFTYYMRVVPSWDFGENFNTSYAMANSNWSEFEFPFYFWGRYPNNIGAVIFLAIPFKVLSLFTIHPGYYYILAILINIIIVDLSLAIMVYIIYKKINLNTAAVASIFMLFITPLYAYSTIVYTDTLAMIFPMLAIMFLILSNDDNERKSIIFLLLSTVSLVIGSWIKTNVIIFLIALIIYMFYKYGGIKLLKRTLILLVTVFFMQSAYSKCAQSFIPVPMEEAGFPATHWVMMGMQGNGWFSDEDANFTANIYDNYGKSKAKSENISMIRKRFEDFGVVGYSKFLGNKMTIIWNDGTYFSPEKLRRNPYNEESFMYRNIVGEDNRLFIYTSQISHIIMLFGIFLSGIYSLKSKVNYITFAQMAIFGNWLFLLMWESRSRYLVYFIPIMIVVAIYGYSEAYKKLRKN